MWRVCSERRSRGREGVGGLKLGLPPHLRPPAFQRAHPGARATLLAVVMAGGNPPFKSMGASENLAVLMENDVVQNVVGSRFGAIWSGFCTVFADCFFYL